MIQGFRRARLLNAAYVVGGSILGISPAYAQNAASPPVTQSPPVSGEGLDIVVTAQRRSERLSQVPISITALSGSALAATGVADTRALTQITPGLNFQSVGSSAQPLIRGIGSTGSSVGDSSNVAIYVDGVYQPFQAANYFQFVDLERIEVLKGPQGTLFGRNAAGGAISITTLDPKFETSGRLGLSYARFGEVEGTAYVTAPLSEKLAFNLSGDYLRNTGFRRDIALDKTLGYKRFQSLRGKLLFQADDRTSFRLAGYYVRFNDLTTFGNQTLNGDTSVRALVPNALLASKKNTSSLSIVPRDRVTNYGASFRATFDLDFASLESLTAFSRASQYVATDSDLTPLAFSQSFITFADNMVSQDLTLRSSGGGAFNWLAGASYYRERGNYHPRSYGGLRTINPNPPLIFGADVNEISIDAYAVFAELTYKLTDRLTLIGGLRYSRDKPGFSGNSIVVATGAKGPTVAASDHFAKATPRISARYALTPRVNGYATYSRGFKSGVFNGNSLQVAPVKPETVDAYEIGLKGAPSNIFSFDAAGYYYDYRNLQFSAFGASTITPLLRNAAKAEIYGFEANASVSPARGLNLRAGLAYTHGKYTDFPNAQGFRPAVNAAGVPIGGNVSFVFDASGQRLIRTPRVQANGTIAYTTGLGNGGKADMNLTASYNSRINHDLAGNFQQKGYAIVNANLGYTTPDGHWKGTVFGTNIFNALPIAGILIANATTSVTYQRPATYGARIEYLF